MATRGVAFIALTTVETAARSASGRRRKTPNGMRNASSTWWNGVPTVTTN